MEMDRPFRIKLPSHKEPEKAKENLTPEDSKPLDQQLRNGLEDLFRKSEAERTLNQSPHRTEKTLQDFETQWAKKLDDAGATHFTDDLRQAVDSIRNGEEPDTEFTIGLRSQFKLTAEAMRRIAKDRTKDQDI